MSKVWVVQRRFNNSIVGVYSNKSNADKVVNGSKSVYVTDFDIDKSVMVDCITFSDFASHIDENGNIEGYARVQNEFRMLEEEGIFMVRNSVNRNVFHIKACIPVSKIYDRVPDVIPRDYLLTLLNKLVKRAIKDNKEELIIRGDEIYE